jgi:hypothetical protein
MKKSIRCIIGVVLGLAGIVQATVVFNFDGATANAATASSNIVNASGTIAAGSSQTYAKSYSTSTALLSNNGSTYTGQSIYGGISATYNNTSATTSYGHNYGMFQYIGTASEQLQVNLTVTNASINYMSRTAGWALMFGPASAGNYKFDASSQLTAKQYKNFGGAAEARWVVVANGTTYLSESTITLGTIAGTVNTNNNPDEINWAAWNPGADMTFGSLSYTNLGSSLNNITLAGVAVDYSAAGADAGGRYYLQGFTADVIPEPATVGMLGLGALLTLALRRRMTR